MGGGASSLLKETISLQTSRGAFGRQPHLSFFFLFLFLRNSSVSRLLVVSAGRPRCRGSPADCDGGHRLGCKSVFTESLNTVETLHQHPDAEGIDFPLLPVAPKMPEDATRSTDPHVTMSFYLLVTCGAPPPPVHSYPQLPSLSVSHSPSSSQHMFHIKLAVLSIVRIVFPFLKLKIIS